MNNTNLGFEPRCALHTLHNDILKPRDSSFNCHWLPLKNSHFALKFLCKSCGSWCCREKAKTEGYKKSCALLSELCGKVIWRNPVPNPPDPVHPGISDPNPLGSSFLVHQRTLCFCFEGALEERWKIWTQAGKQRGLSFPVRKNLNLKNVGCCRINRILPPPFTLIPPPFVLIQTFFFPSLAYFVCMKTLKNIETCFFVAYPLHWAFSTFTAVQYRSTEEPEL